MSDKRDAYETLALVHVKLATESYAKSDKSYLFELGLAGIYSSLAAAHAFDNSGVESLIPTEPTDEEDMRP